MERAALTLEEGWETLELGITKVKRILEGCSEQFTPEEYMNLHTTIYDLCARSAYDYPQQLYEKYKNVLEVYINSTVLPSIKEKHDEFLLKELVKRWCNHNLMLRCLKRFFQYLDQYHTYRRGIPTLYAVGMTCFRDLVYEKVKGKAKDAINALIEKEREGEQIDRALLKNVLDIFVKLGMGKMDLYEDDFEKHMLQETSAYYSRKAMNWIVEHSFPDYMIKYEECLVREKERVSCYLHSSTEPKLVENVQNELLVAYTTQLLEKEHSGVRVLLRDDKEEDLSRMYRLFQKITPGLDHVANAFKKHVTSEGMALIKQAEEAATAASSQAAGSAAVVQDQVLVRKILDLHDKYLAYVSGCFQNHTLLYKAMKEAFEVFCNKTVAGGSSAELLATFCDNILKKGGNEKPSDEAIEETLEKAVKLLVYINHKDLFAEVHRKKLARRLLIDGGANDEHERSILTRLKQQCGGQFTSKMEGMVTDMTLATENQTSFKEYIGENAQAHPGIDLCVTVLTTGFWPTYKSSDLNLPVEMVKGIQAFKEFYDQRSKRRKLNWIYSLGSCNIIGRFEQKPIELIVSTYQAVILLLFNNSDKLSYSEIMARSNVSNEDLLRLLHSLSCSKYKILNKDRNTKTISQTDTFEFNSKFTDRMRRIKIPLASMHERTKVLEDVDEDRRYAIDAAVVRVMKSRKVLPHQRLVSECVEQLNHMFKPDKRSIKKRIEDLITRDYLERDRENPNVFKYLA